jgi:hypothetical protein
VATNPFSIFPEVLLTGPQGGSTNTGGNYYKAIALPGEKYEVRARVYNTTLKDLGRGVPLMLMGLGATGESTLRFMDSYYTEVDTFPVIPAKSTSESDLGQTKEEYPGVLLGTLQLPPDLKPGIYPLSLRLGVSPEDINDPATFEDESFSFALRVVATQEERVNLQIGKTVEPQIQVNDNGTWVDFGTGITHTDSSQAVAPSTTTTTTAADQAADITASSPKVVAAPTPFTPSQVTQHAESEGERYNNERQRLWTILHGLTLSLAATCWVAFVLMQLLRKPTTSDVVPDHNRGLVIISGALFLAALLFELNNMRYSARSDYQFIGIGMNEADYPAFGFFPELADYGGITSELSKVLHHSDGSFRLLVLGTPLLLVGSLSTSIIAYLRKLRTDSNNSRSLLITTLSLLLIIGGTLLSFAFLSETSQQAILQYIFASLTS